MSLTVARCYLNGIKIESCFGTIPDVFRQLWFDNHKELELPDTQINGQDFLEWLRYYRCANTWFEENLLEESKCN